MDERAKRIGYNEALFRNVNERVRELEHGLNPGRKTLEFVCECGDETCTEKISLTSEDYEELRSRPVHFAIVPGHEAPEVERVVSRHERFAVVEKLPGGPAELAAETEPQM